MRAITDLERIGYQFSLEGGRIRYVRANYAAPPADAAFVKALLAKVAGQRAEAVEFLRSREASRGSEDLSAQTQTPGQVSAAGQAEGDPAALWNSVFGGAPDLGGGKARQAMEAELSALIDRWRSDPNPQHTAGYARRYAELAIALGLPYYADDLGSDLGEQGWREWAATF